MASRAGPIQHCIHPLRPRRPRTASPPLHIPVRRDTSSKPWVSGPMASPLAVNGEAARHPPTVMRRRASPGHGRRRLVPLLWAATRLAGSPGGAGPRRQWHRRSGAAVAAPNGRASSRCTPCDELFSVRETRFLYPLFYRISAYSGKLLGGGHVFGVSHSARRRTYCMCEAESPPASHPAWGSFSKKLKLRVFSCESERSHANESTPRNSFGDGKQIVRMGFPLWSTAFLTKNMIFLPIPKILCVGNELQHRSLATLIRKKPFRATRRAAASRD
jgi:hypothetical protein